MNLIEEILRTHNWIGESTHPESRYSRNPWKSRTEISSIVRIINHAPESKLEYQAIAKMSTDMDRSYYTLTACNMYKLYNNTLYSSTMDNLSCIGRANEISVYACTGDDSYADGYGYFPMELMELHLDYDEWCDPSTARTEDVLV